MKPMSFITSFWLVMYAASAPYTIIAYTNSTIIGETSTTSASSVSSNDTKLLTYEEVQWICIGFLILLIIMFTICLCRLIHVQCVKMETVLNAENSIPQIHNVKIANVKIENIIKIEDNTPVDNITEIYDNSEEFNDDIVNDMNINIGEDIIDIEARRVRSNTTNILSEGHQCQTPTINNVNSGDSMQVNIESLKQLTSFVIEGDEETGVIGNNVIKPKMSDLV